DAYQLLEQLGAGNFGSVRKAADLQSEAFVAVKSGYSLEHESATLKKMDHPNIVKHVDFFYENRTTCHLVLELCPGRWLVGME
ncbi:unnamed protein product, partial [Effrenium voratum]